jgi:hypothetical protein
MKEAEIFPFSPSPEKLFKRSVGGDKATKRHSGVSM